MAPRFDPPPDPEIRLVVVFRTFNAALAAMAESLLESDGIEFARRGEMHGWDAPGFLLNVHGRPMEFLVRESDVDRARELLVDLRPDTNRQ